MAARPSIKVLISHLSHEVEGWRKYAANELFHMGPKAKAAVPALIVSLDDASFEVRGEAASALGRIGESALPAVPKLLALVEQPETRLAVLSALSAIAKSTGGLGPEGARLVELISKTVEALSDQDDVEEHDRQTSNYVSLMAGFGLTAVAPLVAILQTRQGDLRQSAASTLGKIGPVARAAVPALLETLKVDDRTLLCFSCRSLGLIQESPELVVPALVQLFDSDDRDILTSAIDAVGEFGPAAATAIPDLLRVLDSPLWVPLEVVKALGKMGPLATAALPALNKLLQVKERYLREAAELAISQIIGHVPDAPIDQVIPANTIDFVRTKTAVVEMLLQGLAKFAEENPDVEVSTVGLFGFGFGQCVSLFLDTPEHSAKTLEQSPDLAQKDKFGQFSSSVYDFAYCEYATDGFEWWPSLYEIGQDFRILLPNGKTVRRSTDKGGNNAIDIPFFKLLQEILKETPITGIRRAKPFRLGVEMANSDLVKFWVSKQ